MSYKLADDGRPRRTCNRCKLSMPDFGHPVCWTCIAGPEASRTSVGASAAYQRGLRSVTPRGATHPRETAPALRQRVGSPRRLPTARELRDGGLDVVERSEKRTRGEEIIRSVLL